LIAADDLVAGRSDLAEHFPRDELAESMLHFLDQTKDRIADELETGGAAATWASVLRKSRDSEFLPAIRVMLRRADVTESGKYSAVQYLWNLGTPQAVDTLREVYDRQVMKAEPWYWLRLCEALAACGDGRGLPDAFEVLLDLERPDDPPRDEQKRKDWENARDRKKRDAEAVFDRAAKETLDAFLGGKGNVTSPGERRIVFRLLWRLPELPRPLVHVIPAWTRSPDPELAEMARRLIERE
jgi:HEAT repeat protein